MIFISWCRASGVLSPVPQHPSDSPHIELPLGGIACQLTVAALVSVGWWNAAFATGAVLAIVAAALWLLADAGHEAHPDARHKAHSPSGIAAIP